MIARAIVARPDLPEEVRRSAYEDMAQTPAQRGKVLMLLARDSRLDPATTATAITPLLLELPREVVFEISDDLDVLLDSQAAGLRSAAVALKVKSGAPLGALAELDPAALLDAVASMSKEQTQDSLPAELIDMAESGQLNAGAAIVQASRLSSDKVALFKRLAALAKPALDLTYDQWGPPHHLAMAALAGMHQTPDEDWPTGYNKYRITRAEASVLELGKEKYFHHEKGCYKCHGKHGEGELGFPPLAQSPMAVGDPIRAATIVKYGMMGEIPHSINPVDGKPYNAQMEPLSYYNDTEMAAALTYVRQSFGNYVAPVTLQHMGLAKEPDADKGEGENMWIASALLTKYPFERDSLTMAPSINVVTMSPPSSGLWLMLGAVAACMLLILGGTYAGKFLHAPHTPTPA